jgi:hypothetical protein
MSDSVPNGEPRALESTSMPSIGLGRASAWARATPERVYAVAFALAAAFSLAPIWSGTVLPFQDWAGNMSYVAILAGVEDGNLYDQTYFTGGMLLPNGLLFWSWVFLGKFMGLIIGGKVLLSLYCVALPASVDRLLAASGRDRRFALLAFPLVYNHSMMMGFGSYATALPFVVYCIARAFQYETDPLRRNGVLVMVFASLTFFAHAQAYLILGVISLTFVAMVPRTFRSFWKHCLAFGASLWIFLPWFYSEFLAPAEDTSLGGRDLMPVFEHPGQMFAKWGEHTINRWQGAFDDWVFLGMLAIMAVGLIARRSDRQPGEGRARYAIEAITFTLLLTYIAIPEHTLVQAVIGSRLVVVVMLFAIGWLHMPDDSKLRGALVTAMTALAVLFGAYAADAVYDFNEDEIGEGFLPLIDSLPDGSTLAVITAERESQAVTVLAHHHIYGYHFALNQGLAFSGFHSFHGRHAQWRPGKHMPYPGRDPRAFLRGKNACVFDYLLVRTTNIPRWQHLAPRLTYMGYSARYSLWKIDHDRIPACRKPKKPVAPKSDAVAVKGPDPSQGAVPDTLRPNVGPTRGRRLDGEWGDAPDDRPSIPKESTLKARPTSAATDRPMFVPRVTGTTSLDSRSIKSLSERARKSSSPRSRAGEGDPPRRRSSESVEGPRTAPNESTINPRVRTPRLRPLRKVVK